MYYRSVSISICIKILFFYSRDCQNNLLEKTKLASGYHHGRGNIKPASKLV